MRASSLGATSSSRSARPEICRSYGAARDLVAIAIKILAPTERKRLDFRHNHPFDAPNAYSRRGQSLLTAYEPHSGLSILPKPGRGQRPGRPIKFAHQFPDQATPEIL